MATNAYTIKEFCGAYGISRTSTYREIAAGHLKIRKIGSRTIILRDDADRWLASLPTTLERGGASTT